MRGECPQRSVRFALYLLSFPLRQRTVDQEDVADAAGPGGIDDLFFGRENMSGLIDADEPGIGAVRHVLDQADRQSDERGVVVNSAVECAARLEIQPGKDEIPQTAVGETERCAGCGEEIGE